MENQDEKFICKWCEREFTSYMGLQRHINYCKQNPNAIKIQYSFKICPHCNQEINTVDFTKHENCCDGTGPRDRNKDQSRIYHLDHDDLFCKWCEKEFPNKNALVQHEIRCNKNFNSQYSHQYQLKQGSFYCQYCSKEFNIERDKNNHETYCELNPEHKDIWNKGQTASTNLSIAQGITTFYTRKSLDPSRYQTMGGFRPNSSKNCKYGTYKGYYCDSSWELAFIVYQLEHNIDIQRNTEGFEYTALDGKKHKYFPDFIINNEYYEIKGKYSENDYLKIEQFPYIYIYYM